eukprot:3511566-Prymnesium_polylepis.1
MKKRYKRERGGGAERRRHMTLYELISLRGMIIGRTTSAPAPFWRCEKKPVAASRNRVLARNRRPATRLSDNASGRKPDFRWQLANPRNRVAAPQRARLKL